MPISMTCDECDRELRLKDQMRGKRIRCPDCGAVLLVESDEHEGDDAEGIAASPRKRPVRSSRATSASESEKPRRRRKAVEEEEDQEERPRRRRRAVEDEGDQEEKPRQKRPRFKKKKKASSSNQTMWIAIGGGSVLVLALVLVLVFTLGGSDKDKDKSKNNDKTAQNGGNPQDQKVDPPPKDEPIVGTWVVSGGPQGAPRGETMIFTRDGALTVRGKTGRYVLNGTTLIITDTQSGRSDTLTLRFINDDEISLSSRGRALRLKRQ